MHMVLVCPQHGPLTIIYQTENREKILRIQYLVRYYIWCSLMFSTRTTAVADLLCVVNDIDIASYMDYNAPYMVADNMNGIIISLEQASNALFEWFQNNL